MTHWLVFLLRNFLNTRFGQWLTPRIFKHASFLIPGKRLRESPNWLVIQHPQPAYPTHFLVLPKREYRDWMSIPAADAPFISELIDITQSLIGEFNLKEEGYRIIINGGKYQDFPHLHVHLVSGESNSD
jgi:histidine triad (HIT) family protein